MAMFLTCVLDHACLLQGIGLGVGRDDGMDVRGLDMPPNVSLLVWESGPGM